MFPSGFLDRLDPSYRRELIKLQKKLGALKPWEKPNKIILELLNDFSSDLLMPKQFWDKMIKIGKGYPGVDKLELAEISIFHLSYLNMSDRRPLHVPLVHDEKLLCDKEREIPRRLLPRHCDKKAFSIEKFFYPHKDLEKNWKEYEENSFALIPRAIQRRYEKSKLLYNKIDSIDPCIVEEWFQALAEAEDTEFVEQNVEYQIGQDLTNKALWKLYIQYLQKNDQKKLLETYSKYCRFFIDDFEMFKEYQKAAEKFGPSKVPWNNTFDFEIFDKNVLCVFKSPTFTPAQATESTCSSHFDVRNALAQKFPFRPNLMEYIIKNANAEILFDLFKCCKWFFARYPIPICYKFQASKWNTEKIQQQSLSITDLSHLKIDKKIFVSYQFFFSRFGESALSKFIPKIYRCTANYVEIYYQNLSMNELKFIIGHGNVLNLKLFCVKDQDEDEFAFEDILKLVPKTQVLSLHDVKYPENLSQYLRGFPFQNKIEEFRLCDMQILPEAYGFAEFMLKNTSTIYPSSFTLHGLKNKNDFGDIIGEEDDAENINFAGENRSHRFQRIIIKMFTLQKNRNLKPELKVF